MALIRFLAPVLLGLQCKPYTVSLTVYALLRRTRTGLSLSCLSNAACVRAHLLLERVRVQSGWSTSFLP